MLCREKIVSNLLVFTTFSGLIVNLECGKIRILLMTGDVAVVKHVLNVVGKWSYRWLLRHFMLMRNIRRLLSFLFEWGW